MSPKFKMDLTDAKNVGKNALLVGVAAALTYVSSNLMNVDLGVYGPLVVPVVSSLLDTVIKWAKNNTNTNS